MSKATSGKNNGMFGKSGEKAVNGRMAIMYDDNKKIVEKFNSVGTALEYIRNNIGPCHHSSLNKAVRENKKYKGYYWYKEFIDRN